MIAQLSIRPTLAHAAAATVMALAVAGASHAQVEAAPTAPPSHTTGDESPGVVRGITISTHGIGRDWGTDVMPPTLRDIASLGANWVSTHPYAQIHRDGRVSFRAFDPDEQPPPHIRRPVDDAHEAGLRVFIKPHIAYWGSGFSWRGDIDFEDEGARARFFETYRAWIVAVARASRGADAFCVGTELDRLLDEGEWRGIIAAVREVTDAKLTYAANWTDFERVKFWDALDAVGIQAYFPIATEPTDDADVLKDGWRTRMGELRAYSERIGKKIVFTELGYNRSFNTPVKPWEAAMDGEEALATQSACYAVALAAIETEPSVVGAFLWKWFPQPSRRRRDHDFRLQHPTIRTTIEAAWQERRTR